MFNAYGTMLKLCCKYKGRTSRKYYILAFIIHRLIGLVFVAPFAYLYIKENVTILYYMAASIVILTDILFFLPMQVRRAHDLGFGGSFTIFCSFALPISYLLMSLLHPESTTYIGLLYGFTFIDGVRAIQTLESVVSGIVLISLAIICVVSISWSLILLFRCSADDSSFGDYAREEKKTQRKNEDPVENYTPKFAAAKIATVPSIEQNAVEFNATETATMQQATLNAIDKMREKYTDEQIIEQIKRIEEAPFGDTFEGLVAADAINVIDLVSKPQQGLDLSYDDIIFSVLLWTIGYLIPKHSFSLDDVLQWALNIHEHKIGIHADGGFSLEMPKHKYNPDYNSALDFETVVAIVMQIMCITTYDSKKELGESAIIKFVLHKHSDVVHMITNRENRENTPKNIRVAQLSNTMHNPEFISVVKLHSEKLKEKQGNGK